MTNSEFLDDIEQRSINGIVFTIEEARRLWTLAGYRNPNPIGAVYMRNSAQYHVKVARTRLKEHAVKRLQGVGDDQLGIP